jgi:hypothetical protein
MKRSAHNLGHQLLSRAAKSREIAGEKMTHQLERYEELYDTHVLRRHYELEIVDSVFVKTHVIELSLPPKLCFRVAGPYSVT